MRYDGAFASIFDDTGLEIENAELLFTDQGVLLYRAYSNGHPYDTSQVSMALIPYAIKAHFPSLARRLVNLLNCLFAPQILNCAICLKCKK